MKKHSTIKKIGTKSAALLLCLATSATAITLAVPSVRGAYAAEDATADSGTIATNVKLDETCDYGKTFAVPAGAKVTAPNGKPATTIAEDGKVLADQLGNYKVTFENDGLAYDFYVRVRLDEEYFLKVDYNGADIPSYMRTGADSSFELPGARVVYYDDNNILQEYPADKYTVIAKDSRGETYNFDGDTKPVFKAGNTTGKVFITYDATVNGESAVGTKHFSQTFTVNLQSKVQTSGNPTLSVSGVQSDVSVNRAVTLPKATATDSYDDKVKVEVKVEGPDKDKGTGSYPVRMVDINDDGYAYRAAGKEYKEVVFDNDQSMTFYPVETGTYKVSYTAYNDSYTANGTTGKSSTREYYITVSDLAAPVFKSIEDYRIPEEWGMVVKKTDDKGDEVETDLGGKITFTIPTVVDNKDKMPTTDTAADDTDLISIYFRITDADNSQNIVTFDNILSTDAKDTASTASTKPGQFKYNSTYEKPDSATSDVITFNLDHPKFEFDFANYAKKNKAGEAQDLSGEYTVLYRARDKANNTSSQTFTITLKETYTDNAKPTTAEVTVPDYISAADETFTVPHAIVADAADTRLKKTYRIYSGDSSIDVEGGEVADIVTKDDSRTLVLNKGTDNEKVLVLGDKLYFYVEAEDNVGNYLTNCEGNARADDDDFAIDTCKAVVTVVPVTDTFNYKVSNMTPDKSEYKAGENVVFGGFTVTTTEAMRNYTGVEVAAYTPKGNVVPVTLQMTSTVNENNEAVILVQNITFNMASATADDEYYSLIVRVFNVNGISDIYGYKVGNVKATDDKTVSTSAITEIGSSGSAYVTYKLKNETISDIPSTEGEAPYRVVRKIKGVVFAVMGSEFIAKAQGSYSVEDRYINDKDIDADSFNFEASTKINTHNFRVTDTASPVIEVQGIMPTYQDFDKTDDSKAAKKTTVQLPDIIAYTANGEAELDIQVKGPKNNKVDYDKDAKTFVATVDGAYTVTVTATYKNSPETVATYTINIGDVQGPEFTLDKGTVTTTTYTVGDTFKFDILTLVDESEKNSITITKKLIDPANETVSDATISGSYTNNNERQNNGTDITFNMAGTYKVVYTATDANNNETKQEFEITVVSTGTSTPTTWTTLSTVLIIVAIVLLAGVIVYVVRFRKVKK